MEVIVNYSGNDAAKTTLEILSGNTVIYSEALSFTQENNSAVIRAQTSGKLLLVYKIIGCR